MNIQEAKQQALEEKNILSDSETAAIKIKLGKSGCSEKDREGIKDFLREKRLFTVRPSDEAMLRRYSMEGVLMNKDVLLVFTNLEECEEYAKRYAAVRLGRNYTIDTIPFESVLRTAGEYEKNVYIDVRYDHDGRFFVYDGKTQTFHICINQKM